MEKESWFSKLSVADISTNKANQLKTVLEPKDEELKEGLQKYDDKVSEFYKWTKQQFERYSSVLKTFGFEEIEFKTTGN